MKGVLVTGATTPIGRAMIHRLVAEGFEAPILAVGAEPDPEGLPEKQVHYQRVDLTRPRSIRNVLFGVARDLDIETIVHNAFHRSARKTGPKAHALNVESTRELLELAHRHPTIRRVVYRSSGDVYQVSAHRPVLITEDHPLELRPGVPQRVRDRVEADITVSTRMGLSPLRIQILRCAEILAPDVGSQLYDYLQSQVSFRPLGFDPMLNVMTVEDAARALVLAVSTDEQGAFNIPGYDTLPLSLAIEKWGRIGIAVPGPLLSPLYRLRATTLGTDFRYDLNHRRFHFSAVLDGSRARDVLGYAPEVPVAWPAGESSRRDRYDASPLADG